MQILWSPKATDSNISGALSRQAIQQQGLGKILVKSVVETSFTD